MILMVFDLGDKRKLIIPARNFLSVMDADGGKGSTITYNLDDNERIVRVDSAVAAEQALLHIYEAPK